MGWIYSQPVTLIFGNGKIKELGDVFAARGLSQGLLISDPVFIKNGMAEQVMAHAKGRLVDLFSDIRPNPTTDNVDACVRIIKAKNLQFAVALGGGSALDCAKAACSVCKTDAATADFHSGKLKLGKACIPLVAIPTTAGTGSEVTPVAVLSDPVRGVKAPLVSDNFFPLCAVIDPELTSTLPPAITASTGMDVLAHALEGFWSKNHQPICDAVALQAARLCFDHLLTAYQDGGNIIAREKMSEASLLAGLAFGLPKTAGVHACSFPLTNVYGVSHGEACAMTLDAFTRINAEAEGGRLHQFARNLFFRDALEMAGRIMAMKKSMQMKISLTDANIPEGEIAELAKLSQHPNMLNNPVSMDFEQIVNMYRSLPQSE